MRNTILILLFSAFQVLANGSYAQTKTISLSMKNAAIRDVLYAIQKQSEFYFLYNSELVDVAKKVDITIEEEKVDQVLARLFDKNDVDFLIKDRYIVLTPVGGNAELLFTQQQQRTVSGKITDSYNQPLPGVTVVVKGTTQGTVTNADGEYTLINFPEDATLALSFVGMRTQEIAIGTQTRIDVRMEEDVIGIEEVVAIGYGVQKKVNLSGAIEDVSAKKLQNRSTNNLGIALQGVVPNLTINPVSGQADATPSYNIRGITSINGGTPLILVDGIPTDPTDFSRMNPADIENLTVLKDASSAAIYGARAAFGVILVTTQKGKTEKLTVQFNNNFNIRRLGRMPKVVMDPYIQASYKVIMGQPWYNLYDEQELDYAKQRVNNPSLPEVIPSFKDPERWSYLATTDWYSEIFNDWGTSNSHNISMSGKTEKVSFYLGGEFYEERGLLKHNKDIYDKFNLRSHIEYKLTNWLIVGNNTSLLHYTYEKPQNFDSWVFQTAHKVNSLLPVKNPDGTWTIAQEGGTVLGNLVGSLQNGGQAKTKEYSTQSQFNSDISIIDNFLHLKADFTVRYSDNKIRTWDSDKNIPYRKGPEMPIEYFGWDNYAQVSVWNKFYILTNIYTDFSKNWGKNNLSFLVGFSQESERYESYLGKRKDMISDSYPTLQLATGEMTVTENVYEWALRSGFFRLNYIFNNKYIFEANGRYDGTSRFPQNDRFGFFPSFSAAWIISEESFFDSLLDFLSHLKIRSSYGSLGNQDVDYYQYIANMSVAKVSALVNESLQMGIYAPGIVSNSLTWEKVQTANVGIDMNLLSNKLIFSGDIYQRNTKGMLTKGKTLPSVLGTGEPKINAADLKTNGWEISLLGNFRSNFRSKLLNYSARFILSDSHTFITQFDNPTNYLGDYYVGQEIGEIWGMVTEGFFFDQADIDSHADQWEVTSYPGDRPIEPGDLKYKDLNDDGKINRGAWTKDDSGDFKIIGNNSNRYNFGIDLNADWNNFDLRILFQGVGKKDWYPGTSYKFFGIFLAPWGNVLESNLDHWTPENTNAYLPRLKSYLANGAGDLGYPQTRYLQNAAYMRMQNLTFGYSLPKRLLGNQFVENLRIYFVGENLFEITPLIRSFDPEGLNEWTHPFQRTFSFGLNITL